MGEVGGGPVGGGDAVGGGASARGGCRPEGPARVQIDGSGNGKQVGVPQMSW